MANNRLYIACKTCLCDDEVPDDQKDKFICMLFKHMGREWYLSCSEKSVEEFMEIHTWHTKGDGLGADGNNFALVPENSIPGDFTPAELRSFLSLPNPIICAP